MLEQLLILLGLALVLGQIRLGRRWLLLAASLLVVFWLQPETSPNNLMFWLPAATILLTALAWFITADPATRTLKQNGLAALVLIACVVLVDLDRFFDPLEIFPVFTPRPLVLGVILAGICAIFLVLFALRRFERFWLGLALGGILMLFVAVKIPAVFSGAYTWLTPFSGSNAQAAPLIRWLGFSYIAFRLIHTIQDRRSGRLPAVTLDEYVTYVIFFPTLSAGPIDRLERFVRELRQPLALKNDDWLFVIRRVSFGLFKKFILADLLAFSAINDYSVLQVQHPGWMWLMVYAYALQIYFDFSGYTDVAIGLGRLLGFQLPENFVQPYLQPNLTRFWNNWHMTLTQWFRAYYFNPLTRALRKGKLPAWAILIFVQISTMVLIGLWHGVTWNYVLWGLWHGLGLFIHNRWSEFQRTRANPAAVSPFWERISAAGSTFLTFNFVALGWVFFALSTPQLSWRVFLTLLGLPL
jgi:alginate O-acetyltransferase complex protein AlgI